MTQERIKAEELRALREEMERSYLEINMRLTELELRLLDKERMIEEYNMLRDKLLQPWS